MTPNNQKDLELTKKILLDTIRREDKKSSNYSKADIRKLRNRLSVVFELLKAFEPVSTKIQIIYEIQDCTECPKVYSRQTPGAGQLAQDFYCKATKGEKKIMGYVENASDIEPVPKWCPHRLEE